jgi:hypothetical protein
MNLKKTGAIHFAELANPPVFGPSGIQLHLDGVSISAGAHEWAFGLLAEPENPAAQWVVFVRLQDLTIEGGHAL